jgi:hypothetical protein
MTEEVYQASPIKRRRATKAEMEARAEFLISYAEAHGPVTVRQLYYRAEVEGLPGIDKTESGYCGCASPSLMTACKTPSRPRLVSTARTSGTMPNIRRDMV